MTETQLREWITAAKPGESTEYYRGFMFRDRHTATTKHGVSYGLRNKKDRGALNEIANHTLALSQQEKILLAQKRHGDLDYSYLAIKAA